MTVTDIMGYSAAILTTLSFLPQAIKVYQSDDTAAISIGMYSMMVLGVALWFSYGLARGDMPLIIANAITFLLAIYIYIRKVIHMVRDKRAEG